MSTQLREAPSGKRSSIQEIHIFAIRDGRVGEHWHEFDKAAPVEQLTAKGRPPASRSGRDRTPTARG